MSLWRAIPTRSRHGYQQPSTRHWLHADRGHPARPSRHAQFYSELVPAMIPVALLGSAVYMVRARANCLSGSEKIGFLRSLRAYNCCRHLSHMKNISTRRARASGNLNRRLMLWCLRGEIHLPLPRSPKRTPQTQEDGSAGLSLGDGELGTGS